MKGDKFAPKQQRFVDEYIKDLNAAQAAIRAGYAPKSAHVTGSQLLANPKVQAAVTQAKLKRSERTQINADWVLQQLKLVWDADVADIIDDLGNYKRIQDWPPIWRKMLQGCDVQELFEGVGKNREKVGEVIKVRFIDRLRNLEMIGKHVFVSAFEERLTLPEEVKLKVVYESKKQPEPTE